jgi:hypothetical protein
VQQFVEEDYLRWDSLGEFLALAASLEFLGRKPATPEGRCWPRRWTRPPASILDHNRSPARKVGELDNRGSHFYLSLYWAQALAAQNDDAALKAAFAPVAKTGRQRGGHRRRAQRRTGQAGGHRRLLPRRSGEDRRSDAPKRHVQRRHRRAGRLSRAVAGGRASPASAVVEKRCA